MAYRFNGSSDRVEFAISPLTGKVFGPLTVAVFLKRGATGNHEILRVNSSVAARKLGLELRTTGNLTRLYCGTGLAAGVYALASTSVWYLLAATWAGGAAMPRYHLHDGTSWAHADPASELVTDLAALVSGDKLMVGWDGVSSLFLNADVVCAGIKNADSSDVTVETLSRTAWSAWTGFGFDWLIGFDSSLESAGILQDQGAAGTGDEIAISGTTPVSDPAGWGWVAAGTTFTKAGYGIAGYPGLTPSSTTYTKTGYATIGGVASGTSASLFVEAGRALVGSVGSGAKTLTGGVTYAKSGYSIAVLNGGGVQTAVFFADVYTTDGYATVGLFAAGVSVAEGPPAMPPAPIRDLTLTPEAADGFALVPAMIGTFVLTPEPADEFALTGHPEAPE